MIRNILCLVFCLVLAFNLVGQQLPYYVVIGAYAIENNAQRATLQAHTLNYPATYGFNSAKKFYYVYVRVSKDRALANETLKEIRTSGFRDAWIFQGALEYSSPNPVATSTPHAGPTEVTANTSSNKDFEPITLTDEDVKSVNEDIVRSDSVINEEQSKTGKPAGRGFVFKLISENTGNEINGMVRLQENDRSNQFHPFIANNLVYVAPPSNRNGRWMLVCHVVGYKPLKTFFSYKDVEKLQGVTVGSQQEVILPVSLERVKKGDYMDMEAVRFYTNSNIMHPESEKDLKELVAMMNENPRYNIRIHGHTNGPQPRDIVSLGESSDLFNTNSQNKKQAGSAKLLSSLRAESVKLYLVNNGIAAKRIAVKGEGGSQMIYDPKGTLAGMNDRVEIEITKH